jgi:uncharacterized membrane protein
MNEQASAQYTPPSVSQCLSDGWELYKREPGLLSAVTLVAAILSGIAGTIPFAGLLVYGPLLGGMYLLIMRLDRSEGIEFARLFDGFNYFLPLLMVSLLTSILVTIGLILLVLPGIYLAIAYSFSTLNVVSRGLDFWPAMEASRKTITRHFLQYALLGLICFGIFVLSAIPFGLGLLISVPVCLGAQYSFYKRVCEEKPA